MSAPAMVGRNNDPTMRPVVFDLDQTLVLARRESDSRLGGVANSRVAVEGRG